VGRLIERIFSLGLSVKFHDTIRLFTTTRPLHCRLLVGTFAKVHMVTTL
jgi:hypothetical protein